MIRAVTFHAIDRLRERRGISHVQEHLDKLRQCGAPSDGVFVYKKGYRYVMRDGVLITVLPPDNEAMRQSWNEEMAHRLAKVLVTCPEALNG